MMGAPSLQCCGAPAILTQEQLYVPKHCLDEEFTIEEVLIVSARYDLRVLLVPSCNTHRIRDAQPIWPRHVYCPYVTSLSRKSIVTKCDCDQHTTTNTQPDFGSVLIKNRTKFEVSKMCHS